MRLKIPFPPSVNGYWRSFRGRQILSKRAREYRAKVVKAVASVGKVDGPCSVIITLHPPDKRRRDVDNYSKAILDALTHAGIWDDDSQVKQLVIGWPVETLTECVLIDAGE